MSTVNKSLFLLLCFTLNNVNFKEIAYGSGTLKGAEGFSFMLPLKKKKVSQEENKRKVQHCPVACNQSEDFHLKGPESERIHLLVLPQIRAYRGSTAFQQLLMSNPAVSTLCTAKTWQCEGWKIRRARLPFDNVKDASKLNFEIAFNEWVKYWNLSSPALLEKTPTQVQVMQELFDFIKSGNYNKKLGKLKPVYIFVWRPACLRTMSSHKSTFKGELGILNQMLELYEKIRHQAPTILINYAEMLWKPDKVAKRLHNFFACLPPGFNPDYVPVMEKDIFWKNMMKTHATIREYGRRHRPIQHGYSLADMICTNYGDVTEQDKEIMKTTETHLINLSNVCG
eukprot:m.324177 g.324177  ORF g.324177 m.324177 type:complete len:340 (-) comp16540_c10_seq24:156-1175(-)